jgi:hypothetical protein
MRGGKVWVMLRKDYNPQMIRKLTGAVLVNSHFIGGFYADTFSTSSKAALADVLCPCAHPDVLCPCAPVPLCPSACRRRFEREPGFVAERCAAGDHPSAACKPGDSSPVELE